MRATFCHETKVQTSSELIASPYPLTHADLGQRTLAFSFFKIPHYFGLDHLFIRFSTLSKAYSFSTLVFSSTM